MKIPSDTDIVMDPKTREMRLTWRGLFRFWLYDVDWRAPRLSIQPPRGYRLMAPVARALGSHWLFRTVAYIVLWYAIYYVAFLGLLYLCGVR